MTLEEARALTAGDWLRWSDPDSPDTTPEWFCIVDVEETRYFLKHAGSGPEQIWGEDGRDDLLDLEDEDDRSRLAGFRKVGGPHADE
jgi:hypothetical protein